MNALPPAPLIDPEVTAALMVELAAVKAKLAASENRADAEAARAENSLKALFLVKFRSIGFHDSRATLSNTAETSGSAPPPTTVALEEVIGHSYPAPLDSTIRECWGEFCSAFSRNWVVPKKVKTDEDRDVHPVIRGMLDALLKDPELRLWWNKPTREAKAKKKVRPDFTVTHTRDSYPTLIGAALTVEVKNPAMESGKSSQFAGVQSRGYLRRRLLQVLEECDLRGEPLHTINGFTVGTDGETLTVAHMLSGAPPPGVTFEGCEPCPVKETGPLELLKGWDFHSPPRFSDTPPPGFRALAHLCSLPPSYLLGPSIVPLTRLRVRLLQVGVGVGERGAADAPKGGEEVDHLILRSRLGCGGSSDTYACIFEGWGGGGSGSGISSLVLKTPRTGTVGACYTRERTALLLLQQAPPSTAASAASMGLVPTLHYWGTRACALDWPVLLMTPVGVPIAAWTEKRCEGMVGMVGGGGDAGGGGGGGAAAEHAAVLLLRRQCAGEVCFRLISALKMAHGLGLIHCDVRPENVVMASSSSGGGGSSSSSDSEGGGANAASGGGLAAVLVDWGISRKHSEAAQGAGLATYASRAVFSQGSYSARPLQDLVAVMYTWLSVAFSPKCKAPWGHVHVDSMEEDYNSREVWISTHCPLALVHIDALHKWTPSKGCLYQLTVNAVTELSQRA